MDRQVASEWLMSSRDADGQLHVSALQACIARVQLRLDTVDEALGVRGLSKAKSVS
jgi:hypothetical protein